MRDHLSEEQLAALVLAEDEAGVGAAAHLKACTDCRDSLDEMRGMLAAVKTLPVPERNEAYGRDVWARLQPRLEDRRTGWQWWPSAQQWALGVTMALILVFGVLVGRFTAPPSEGDLTEAQIRERILLVAVGEHLDRSQMVLVELVNAGGNGTVDISAEQEWAQDLIADNRLYRLTAAETGDAALADLLDDLERILLEVAHSPEKMESDDFEDIRAQIEEQGILFKIRILSSQVREREGTGWNMPAPGNSQS